MVVRARSFPSHWWPPLLMGALFGGGRALALRAVSLPQARGSGRPGAKGEQREGTTDAARQGTEEVRVRSFGQGICELVGSAGGELYVAALIRVLAAEPGVSAVVNRVWTPESGGAA
jgi:hypothetical protein